MDTNPNYKGWFVSILLKYLETCKPCKTCLVQATCEQDCDEAKSFIEDYIDYCKSSSEKIKEVTIELMYNISKKLLEGK